MLVSELHPLSETPIVVNSTVKLIAINATMTQQTLYIRQLGLQPYDEVWQQMRDYTDNRTETSQDELWLLEHPPVFTQGQNGKAEHILNAADIPVVQTDRGGQVTYHGPGQLVGYLLIDIGRRHLKVRSFVNAIEQAMINTLANYNITAQSRCDAPGVYVQDAKICSLGLRVRKGRSYHGLALNVNMDLSPFSQINPCGFSKMAMTQICDLGGPDNIEQVSNDVVAAIAQALEYTQVDYL